MATLILSAVGTAVAGPIGGLVGSFLGASIDRRIFGSNSGRQSSRAGNLVVQSSAYGEAIPRLYGRMRVAGNLIWSPGIRETQVRAGGGKQRSGTGYTYSASFAVVLAARQVHELGRIWADGKLLRNGDGSFVQATTMRFYAGNEDQSADPLVVATEGPDNAPAYRGLAYVVFEDLALADFGNRIPNLTFETIADVTAPDAADIAADLFEAAGLERPGISGDFAALDGFAAAHGGSLRSQIEVLMPVADLSIVDDGAALAVRSGASLSGIVVPANDLGTAAQGELATPRQHDTRAGAALVPDALAIGFYDPARDYQLGLQRAVRRSPVIRSEQHDIAVALSAAAAKALAERMIGATLAARTSAEIRLPWRHCGLRVGETLTAGEDLQTWRVRSLSLESMVLRLMVERLPRTARAAVDGAVVADPGRSLPSEDLPNGPTTLHVLDLPPLPGTVPVTPRIWLAAAGAEAGWRRAEIEVSRDDGDSYDWVASIRAAATMGVADQPLAPGPAELWDRQATVDVTLINAAMWLESRSERAVLDGANLALLGDELIQFATAEAISPQRFRLSGLLRGRRGSEAETGRHVAGERFVMLDPERLSAFDVPIESLGRTYRFRTVHRGGAVAEAEAIVPTGVALRPLCPVHIRAQSGADGGTTVCWTRRSRNGFTWIDSIDAPLAEEVERYRVELWHSGVFIRTSEVSTSAWVYSQADRIADGLTDAAACEIRVQQIGATIGLGKRAIATIELG